MDFLDTLQKGILLKRYKRFFADINFNGKIITAHLPNTGSMKSIPLSETPCYFSTSDDPKRKLKYTLELIQTPTGLAGVNTRTPNKITSEALSAGLKGPFENIQAELKVSDKTRIDFVLWNWLGEIKNKPKKLKFPDYLTDKNLELHFIEVKNVSMSKGQIALFPDGVTQRGTKHLNELIELKQKGFTTEILFVVQRENILSFKGAKEIDPLYCETLNKAKDLNVKISAYKAKMTRKKISLIWKEPLEIKL